VVVWAPAAGAHPRLLSAEPEPSATVTGPLAEVTVRFDERVDWSYSTIKVEDTEGASLLSGEPRLEDRKAVLPLAADAFGAMRVFWQVVGDDAHPVIGAFVLGVRDPSGATAGLDADLSQLARLGEGEGGSGILEWAVRGSRSLEIILLYLVLGILLLRTVVLRGRLAFAGGGPGTAAVDSVAADRGYRLMLRVGILAAVVMPFLFVLYVARLQSVVRDVAFSDVVFSTLGQTWTMKTLLWAGMVAGCVYGLRHFRAGSRQHDLMLLGLAASIAVAFGLNTHTAGESPGLLWGAMMFGHIMVTAFWAGGLVALLLLVFPTGDSERVWRAVGRFSRIMTVTVLAIVASGVVMLLQLSANWKSMWCSDFGLVAGFKMAVVGIALVIGTVNNRLVAYQERSLDAPVSRFRPHKERSVASLRRLVTIEAAVLGSAILLSGALGETELPAVFQGNYFPLDLQETVRPGLFGSGCG
ncbi:MAG: copper resistance CopC/CopD family protein, partial [Acidimicrobiia bacterium]